MATDLRKYKNTRQQTATSAENKKRKADAMTLYYQRKGDTTSYGAKAAQRAEVNAEKAQEQTKASANPALANAIVSTVTANRNSRNTQTTSRTASTSSPKISMDSGRAAGYENTIRQNNQQSDTKIEAEKNYAGYLGEKLASGIYSGTEGVVNGYLYQSQMHGQTAMNREEDKDLWQEVGASAAEKAREDFLAEVDAAGGAVEYCAKNNIHSDRSPGATINRMANQKAQEAGNAAVEAAKENKTERPVANEFLTGSADYAEEVAQKYTREAEKLGFVGDAVGAIGQMIPSIAANIVAPGTGMGVLFEGAMGNATQEAVRGGADVGSATAYGIAVGTFEVLSEGLTGGIPTFGKGSLDEAAEEAIKSTLKNKTAQGALLYLYKAAGEGFEEFVTEYADAVANKVIIAQDERGLGEISKDAVRAAALGSITSGVLQGVEIGGQMTKEKLSALADNLATETVNNLETEQAAQTSAGATQAENQATTPTDTVQADTALLNTRDEAQAQAEAEAQPTAAEARSQVDASYPQVDAATPAEAAPKTTADFYAERNTKTGEETEERKKNIVDNAAAPAYTDSEKKSVGGAANDSNGIARVGVRDGRSGTETDKGVQVDRDVGRENLSVPGVVLLSDRSKLTLSERGVAAVDVVDTTDDNAAFSSALDDARAADVENGWAVTPKTEAALNESGTRTFMTPERNAGFAIAPDGDIEAVFANKSAGAPKGVTKSTMPIAVANGGTKLDCYGETLAMLYANYGFVPVARTAFNAAEANDGWTPDKGEQTIYFMMHNGDTADTVVENMKRYSIPTLEELEALPMMEYDEAYAYRDRMLAERKAKSSDSLYTDTSVGAAQPMRGEQVKTQNVAETSPLLSEEGRQAAQESTPTHERKSWALTKARAESYIARDADGNWVNLQDVMDDLASAVENGEQFTAEMEKLSSMVLLELEKDARETGDWTAFNQYNKRVFGKSATGNAQALNIRLQMADTATGTVLKASEILDGAKQSKDSRKAKAKTNKTAEDIEKIIAGQVNEAADETMEQLSIEGFEDQPTVALPDVPAIKDLIKKSWQDKQAGYEAVLDYYVQKYGMSEQEAALAANNIATKFYDALANKSEAALKKMYGKKNAAGRKSWIDAAVEKINMGALTSETYRDIASQKLFGSEVDNETLTKVSVAAEKAQNLRDAGDRDGLQAHAEDLATQRGYTPGKVVQKALGKMDADTLYNLCQTEALAIASDQVKASGLEMAAQYQYLAQLLNAKTLMRNVVSNQLFAPIDRIAQNLGILPDYVLAFGNKLAFGKTLQQNRAVGYEPTTFDKRVRETRKNYVGQARVQNALDVNLDESRKNKYTDTTRTTNRTFDRYRQRALNKAEGALGFGLNVTDAFQKGTTKGQSEVANERLKAKGGIMTEEAAKAITEREMLYRSFQRETPIGNALGSIKRFLNANKSFGVGSLVNNYTGVPGALVHTMADYTPLGVINVGMDFADMLKYNNGKYDNADLNAKGELKAGRYKGLTPETAATVAQHDMAVSVGRSLTGSGIALMAYGLAKLGLLVFRPYGGDDKDEDQTRSEQGQTGLQLNATAFLRLFSGEDATPKDDDLLISLDQLQPLSYVAEVGVIMATEDDDAKFMDAVNASVQAVANSFQELSMMETVGTVADSIRYKGDKDWAEWIGDTGADVAADSVSGLIPGPVRQAAQATDRYYRDTNGDTFGERAVNQFKYSVPGLRQTLPTKADYTGEDRQYTVGTVGRLLNSFVLPASVTRYQQDDVIDFIDVVGDDTGKSLYAAAYAPSSVNVKQSEDAKSESHALTTEDKRAYRETYNKTYYGYVGDLMNADWAKDMDKEDAADILGELRSLANDTAKREYANANGLGYTSDYDKYQEIDDPVLYLSVKKTLETMADSDGNNSAGFGAVLDEYKKLSDEQKELYADKIQGLEKVVTCMNAGMDAETYYEVKSKHDELNKTDGMKSSEKQQSFEYWIDQQNMTDKERTAALETMVFTSTSVADASKYSVMTDSGIGDKAADAIFKAVSTATDRNDGKTLSDKAIISAIVGAGQSDRDTLKAIETYIGADTGSYKYLVAADSAGIDLGTWAEAMSGMETVSMANLFDAMDRAKLTTTQRREMYDAYKEVKGWKKSYTEAYEYVY